MRVCSDVNPQQHVVVIKVMRYLAPITTSVPRARAQVGEIRCLGRDGYFMALYMPRDITTYFSLSFSLSSCLHKSNSSCNTLLARLYYLRYRARYMGMHSEV